MLQVARCPRCAANLALPTSWEENRGAESQCPCCDAKFALSDQLVEPLEPLRLLPATPAAAVKPTPQPERQREPEPKQTETITATGGEKTLPFSPDLFGKLKKSEPAPAKESAKQPIEETAKESAETKLADFSLADFANESTSDSTGDSAGDQPSAVASKAVASRAVENKPAEPAATDSLSDWLKRTTEPMLAKTAPRRESTPPEPVKQSLPEFDTPEPVATPKPKQASNSKFTLADFAAHDSVETPEVSTRPAERAREDVSPRFDFEVGDSKQKSPADLPVEKAEPVLAHRFDAEGEFADNEFGKDSFPEIAGQRGRSALKQMAAVAGGATLGVTGAYYLLLALGGPDRDSLGVADYLPSSVLPSSFAQASADPAGDMLPPVADSASGDSVSDLADPFAKQDAAESLAAFETTGDGSGGAEQTSFDSPSDAPPTLKDSPYGSPVDLTANVAEPAPPEPAPFVSVEPGNLAEVGINNAPVYSFEQLAESLIGAEEAGQHFADYSLADEGAAKTLGQSYAKLCELAQVLSFVDTDASHSEMMIRRLEARELFRKLFRYDHARGDTRQIASRWIPWQGRPHGGVFFAGLPKTYHRQGLVHEYTFELIDGQLITVLSDKEIDQRRFGDDDETIGVIGCVIDSPATQIAGYTGDAERAVWIATTLALPAAEYE